MHILHVTESYTPASGGVSGSVKVLSEGLVRLGHKVTVATQYHPMRHYKELNGVNVIGFDLGGKVDSGYKGEVEKYQEFIRNFSCDLLMIYAAQTWASDLVFPLLNKLNCTKVFIPCGYSSLYNPDFFDYYRKMPNILSNFDHIVYFDKYSRDYSFGNRHNIQHFSIIPECADLEGFSSDKSDFRKRYKIHTKYMLLHVASYGRNKAQHFLLEAFLKAKYQDTTLVCIGPKPIGRKDRFYFLLLKLMAHAIQMKTGIGTIRLLKGVKKDLVVSAFYESDLFLLGSTFEVGTPLVIYESMAAGLPFISTASGSLGELNYGGGIVVTSPHEMSRAIEILLSNKNMREALADKGREDSDNLFTPERYITTMHELYQQLMSSKQK